MKFTYTLLFVSLSIVSSAQGSLKKFLEVGNPADLEEMIGWAMDPRHAEGIKAEPDVVRKFVNLSAKKWNSVSQSEVASWKKCMEYFISLGIPLNGKSDDVDASLMYYTFPRNLGIQDSASTLHQLHTVLLPLGGMTDVLIDGESMLFQVLSQESKESIVFKSYLQDFKGWDEDRKRDWLFSLVESNALLDEEVVSIVFGNLLSEDAFDVNIRSKNEKTSLFDEAAKNGKFLTAKVLLDYSFNVNQRCFACEGQTSLHNVVMNKDYSNDDNTKELILKMLAKGGDPDLRDLKGLTPIHYAIKLKNDMAFRAFMDDEVKFNYQLGTLKGMSYYTYFVEEWGDEDYLEIFVKKTSLKAPPTKKEIKEAQDEKKEEAKAKAKKKN